MRKKDENLVVRVDEIAKTITESYRGALDTRNSIDVATLILCYDRDFCRAIKMPYNNVEYGLIKLAVVKANQ